MTRLRADLLLLLASIIWGTTFIAQKTMSGIGPFEFVAARFALSFFCILPLAVRETKRRKKTAPQIGLLPVIALCATFSAGVILQQLGIALTTVTNAGFLTGLYVVMTPLAVWVMFKRAPRWFIWLACGFAVLGFWFINGGSLTAPGAGDFLIVLCTVFYGVQVALIGYIMEKTAKPFTYSALQYAVCAVTAFVLAGLFEHPSLQALAPNWVQIVYAGILSGGIAYTLQPVAQQYTPAAEASIIMASEALFAALAGYLILGDRLDFMGWAGCGLILAAILLVEAGPLLRRRV